MTGTGRPQGGRGEGASRGAGAARAAALGLAGGAVLGLLDAVRARLETGSVLAPRYAPLVVLLYAGAALLPAAAAPITCRPPMQ